MLDEWMAGDVHGPLLRMAIESEVLQSYPHMRHLGHTPTSTSSMFGQSPHLAFDARNFIADEDWAELNSYEGLMQLSERLGAAEVCVPQGLIDTLPTCEYGKWDGGSCRQRDALSASPPLVGKGKGKQKVEPPANARDTMCPICREDYLDSDMLMSINKCCHAFHADCIKVSAAGNSVICKPIDCMLTVFLLSSFLLSNRPGSKQPRPVHCVEPMRSMRSVYQPCPFNRRLRQRRRREQPPLVEAPFIPPGTLTFDCQMGFSLLNLYPYTQKVEADV